jgi:hypothetical protein
VADSAVARRSGCSAAPTASKIRTASSVVPFRLQGLDRTCRGQSVPAGEEHWHGGTASNVMCHISMLEGTRESDGTTWLEPVIDEEYAVAPAQTTSSADA